MPMAQQVMKLFSGCKWWNVSIVVRIGQAARETDRAQDVHREERAVEEDERQEEVHLAPDLVHHPAEHLGEPEIDRRRTRPSPCRQTARNGSGPR